MCHSTQAFGLMHAFGATWNACWCQTAQTCCTVYTWIEFIRNKSAIIPNTLEGCLAATAALQNAFSVSMRAPQTAQPRFLRAVQWKSIQSGEIWPLEYIHFWFRQRCVFLFCLKDCVFLILDAAFLCKFMCCRRTPATKVYFKNTFARLSKCRLQLWSFLCYFWFCFHSNIWQMFFGQRYFSCDDSILCLIFVFCLTVMRIVWCPVFGVQLFKKMLR